MSATTDRIAFLNGSYVPLADAKVSIMDRGFTLADGIYEVSAVLDGKMIDNEAHLGRLDRSLAELGIANPYSIGEWIAIEEEMIVRNGLTEGVVYMQVTRGVAEREFVYRSDLTPTVVLFTQVKTILASPLGTNGAKIITVPDLRWARRDIKSVALLAQVIAKQAAADAGAAEAWMVRRSRNRSRWRRATRSNGTCPSSPFRSPANHFNLVLIFRPLRPRQMAK